MGSCPRAAECGLAAAFESKVALLLWEREFCRNAGRRGSCERLRLLEAGEPVPRGLLPNGQMAPAPGAPAAR